jgi:RNA polymerase sigma-70 factor (ECF subfamily)
VRDAAVTIRPEAEVEAVYREHGARMWRYVSGFAGDPDVASDAVAEAFAQALRRGEALRSPAAWIWRTAFRVAAAELKARRRRVIPPLGTGSEPDTDAADLARALSRLPERLRIAVVLHYVADCPVKEVAHIVGASEAAVRMRLTRARRRLREMLEDSDV